MDEEKKEGENPGEIKETPKKKFNFTEKVRENPWVLATFVCGLLIVILLASTMFGGFTGNAISTNTAEDKFLDYLDSAGADINDITITSISLQSGLYEIYFDYQDEPYPIPYYLTKDGKLVGMMSAITEPSAEEISETQTEVTKSGKPIVELFIMSYCPYGTQAEKGIIPAVELLGDKIDFRIRYVYYLMHGEKEAEENLREYCIQEIAPEKFLDYMTCFLEGDGVESSGGYVTNGNDINSCLALAGIDADDLETCMAEADTEFSVTQNLEDEDSWLSGYYPLFDVDAELNEKYEIQGSPTLVINGVQVSSSRDSASYLSAICSAFNDSPEECSTELSSETPSPYFGWDSTGASTTASCG
jgi:hypothetical protein